MIDQLSLDEWRAFDAAHPAPTFFARPGWALALADVYPALTPSLLRIRTGRREPVLVPVMAASGGKLGLRRLNAFPLGGYTCFMRENGELAPAEDAQHALDELRRFAHAGTLIPWPLGPVPSYKSAAPHETAVVDLSGGIEKALANVDGTFRRMAGQAARRGVVCEPSSEPDAVDGYYELLSESAKRWGIPQPTERRALIEALVRHGGRDVEIWFARAEGRRIAGGVVFYGSSEFFFWSAAMLAEFGRLRPSNALNFALLNAAAARGMQWYNLGSSEGLPGVARFKRDLGATDVSYAELHFASMPLTVFRQVRQAFSARRME